jgi:hypothetical protein
VQVNSIDKHDFRGSDDLSCRANCLDDMVALFLLIQDHEEPSLTSLEIYLMPCLKEEWFIVLFIPWRSWCLR